MLLEIRGDSADLGDAQQVDRQIIRDLDQALASAFGHEPLAVYGLWRDDRVEAPLPVNPLGVVWLDCPPHVCTRLAAGGGAICENRTLNSAPACPRDSSESGLSVSRVCEGLPSRPPSGAVYQDRTKTAASAEHDRAQ